MTDAELARLPSMLREIVETDRALKAWRGSPVVIFDTFRRLRETRASLRKAAESRWGYRLAGDGSPATSS